MAVLDRQMTFPYAPEDWTPEVAEDMARAEGMELQDDHWVELGALQEYYVRHECDAIHTRELSDALDEKFHTKGGFRYLYKLFPRGPIAQGCRLAGLVPPSGSIDLGFGSVR